MIHTGQYFREIVTLSQSSGLSRSVHSGDVVRVQVLDSLKDGTLRVRISGVTLSAADIGSHAPGDVFSARVRFSGDSVLLQPLFDAASAQPTIFASLGISETPVTGFLVAFFQSIRAKMDSTLIRALAQTASRFPGKEIRAAEAAALLAERGIEPSDDAVARMIRCIEGEGSADGDAGLDSRASGNPGGNAFGQGTGQSTAQGEGQGGNQHEGQRTSPRDGDGDTLPCDCVSTGQVSLSGVSAASGTDRAFLSFVNMKKGSLLHWIVVPYKTAIQGHPCAGSVRYLLDLDSRRALMTRVTCMIKGHDWDFDIGGDTCGFTSAPPFDAVLSAKFSVYLKGLLAKVGVSTVVCLDHDSRAFYPLPHVDVRA